MKLLALTLALACFGSFTWAMNAFFVKPDGRTRGMQAIYVLGTLFVPLHLVLIYLRFQFAPWPSLAGCALYGVALALFWWAVQANRARPLSFAFSTDAPRHLVVQGPYRYLRHPFYAAYTYAWLAGVLLAREPWLLATVAVMFALYHKAATEEEAKFAASDLAQEYARYRSTTWMFLPRP